MTPGYTLDSKYRLISLLGRGGMGSVWRAEHLQWHAAVAVKVMDRAAEASPETVARFHAEARLAANLRSPHVVQILDDGRDAASGTPFIVMELLIGESLAQRLGRVQRLSPSETATIVTHVARALSLAHELPMVHRDLKPDNVFLVRNDDEDIAKVLDFGIAKWSAESLAVDAPTATGTVMGTPFYMSPEQIRDSKRVDYRSDLWSLGVIAYECLTGVRPFRASNLVGLALEISRGRAPAPSTVAPVPSGFDAWFQRATAHELQDRFQSARELADELRQICGQSFAARTPSGSEGVGRSAPSADGVAGTPRSGEREVAAVASEEPIFSRGGPTATFHGPEAHARSVIAVTQTAAGPPRARRTARWTLVALVAGVCLSVLGPWLLLRSRVDTGGSAPAPEKETPGPSAEASGSVTPAPPAALQVPSTVTPAASDVDGGASTPKAVLPEKNSPTRPFAGTATDTAPTDTARTRTTPRRSPEEQPNQVQQQRRSSTRPRPDEPADSAAKPAKAKTLPDFLTPER